MVIIVGTLLAAIDSSLKDKIKTNKILEKQQNILYAIGINNNEGNSVSFVSTDQTQLTLLPSLLFIPIAYKIFCCFSRILFVLILSFNDESMAASKVPTIITIPMAKIIV
jgi:Na+-transporting NADH:ubiquinone oxidoreductase subunit NqrC